MQESTFTDVEIYGVMVMVEKTHDGYRIATFDGSSMIVRPDGSECFSTVQSDSPRYGVMNDAIWKIWRA